MTGQYGTKFIESEIVLAVQAGDEAEARDLISDMFGGERRELKRALERAVELIEEESR